MPKIETIEPDHFPEVVDDDKGFRRIELLGLKEHLGAASDRRAFFATMSDERFQDMLGYINSTTRGRPIDYDYDGVVR